MPGRPRIPDELKAQKGTLQACRALEPAVRFGKLDSFVLPPKDLPSAGREEWNRVMGQLHPLGILTSVDLSLLKSYCHHVAAMEEAAAKLAEEGHVIFMDGAFGPKPTKNPWAVVYNEASDRASKLGQQFGFTPSSRTRIVAPTKQPEADPWADM